jgi:hypothetical protein
MNEAVMRTISTHLSWTPVTHLGRQSVWLAIAFLLMFLINVPINIYLIKPGTESQMTQPLYAAFVILMLIAGAAGGMLGMIAVTKWGERSPLVWVSILCGVFVVLLVLNEIVEGIQYMRGI